MTGQSQGSELSQDDDSLRHIRHDISNHINQIVGYSELITEELTETSSQDNELLDALAKITQAAGSIQVLVKDQLVGDRFLVADPSTSSEDGSTAKSIESLCEESLSIIQTSAHLSPKQIATGATVPGRILIVDDEEENRSLLVSRLTREGFSVAEACDGEQALAKAKFDPFDVILLDILMPKLDGFQTLLRLKRDEKLCHIPVIMISGLDDLSVVVPCIEAGAEDYLSKPFNRVLLRARIDSSLEKKLRHDEELNLYKKLMASKSSLQSTLDQVRKAIKVRVDHDTDVSNSDPLLQSLKTIVGDLEQQSEALTSRIKQIEIRINRQAVTSQVRSITDDPSFSTLAERAKAIRQRRRGSAV